MRFGYTARNIASNFEQFEAKSSYFCKKIAELQVKADFINLCGEICECLVLRNQEISYQSNQTINQSSDGAFQQAIITNQSINVLRSTATALLNGAAPQPHPRSVPPLPNYPMTSLKWTTSST
jgi:hypothetical protein